VPHWGKRRTDSKRRQRKPGCFIKGKISLLKQTSLLPHWDPTTALKEKPGKLGAGTEYRSSHSPAKKKKIREKKTKENAKLFKPCFRFKLTQVQKGLRKCGEVNP